jgi:hypothetical protein
VPYSQRSGGGCSTALWVAIIGIPILAIAGVGIWKSQQPDPQPQPTPIPVPVIVSTPQVKVRPGKKAQNNGWQIQPNDTGNTTDNQQANDSGIQVNSGGDNSAFTNHYNQQQQQRQQQVDNFDQQIRQPQQASIVSPSSYSGIWQSTMSDGYRSYNCFITNYPNGTYVFATSCPQPFAGEVGKVQLYTNGTWRLQATNRYRVDQGTYQSSPNHNHMQGSLGAADWYKVR